MMFLFHEIAHAQRRDTHISGHPSSFYLAYAKLGGNRRLARLAEHAPSQLLSALGRYP